MVQSSSSGEFIKILLEGIIDDPNAFDMYVIKDASRRALERIIELEGKLSNAHWQMESERQGGL